MNDNDYKAFQKWMSGQKKKEKHTFRNFILILIVLLTLWFVLDKASFLGFWKWLFGLF